MDLFDTIFALIDMRSFSNLWYWIALAAIWSTASHYVIGVPFDMIARAARHGGAAQSDLEQLVQINVNRMLYIARVSGLWLIAFVSMLLSGLALLGFWYRVEFAQAVFLIGFPMTLVGLLSFSTARRIEAEAPEGEALRRRLIRHRRATQVIGMLAIFVTAMWGMYQNMAVGPLGR